MVGTEQDRGDLPGGDTAHLQTEINLLLFLFPLCGDLSPSLNRAMLAPGAFLEFLVQELPRGKLEGKARRERRAEKVWWQVQLGLGCSPCNVPKGWLVAAKEGTHPCWDTLGSGSCRKS